MKRLLTLAASAIALASAPASAQDMVIANATVVTGDGSEPIENGVVVIENGRVTYAGAADGRSFQTDTLIDVDGAWVTPGLFATVTTLGLVDVGAVSESNDSRAGGSPFSAALDVAPVVNPNSQNILIHRAAGITRAATTTLPSASIFAGQGAIIDLDSDSNPIVKARAFQMVDLGEGGARRAGGSRAAAHALFRNALFEARNLDNAASISGRASRAPSRGSGDDTPLDPRMAGNGGERGDDVLLSRFDAAALVPIVTGQQPLYISVERASDILSALDLRKDFPNLDMVLVGVSEGWLVANEIAASGVPVLADPLDALPTGFDQLAATQSNIGRMKDAGVKVGINTAGIENPRRLAQQAGNLVGLANVPGATGLTWGEAFAAISSIPAEISGMGGQAGVLAAGALGDVVIWDGDPLEVTSVPTKVYIGGVDQPLGNHQSRLKERYRDLDESDLPKAYDW